MSSCSPDVVTIFAMVKILSTFVLSTDPSHLIDRAKTLLHSLFCIFLWSLRTIHFKKLWCPLGLTYCKSSCGSGLQEKDSYENFEALFQYICKF